MEWVLLQGTPGKWLQALACKQTSTVTHDFLSSQPLAPRSPSTTFSRPMPSTSSSLGAPFSLDDPDDPRCERLRRCAQAELWKEHEHSLRHVLVRFLLSALEKARPDAVAPAAALSERRWLLPSLARMRSRSPGA